MKNISYFTAFFYFLVLTVPLNGADDKEKVWYEIDISGNANPIYVDYKSIEKKGRIAKYEQMEFHREKKQLVGTDKVYQFVVSKRELDCEEKKYLIKEEKYFDSKLNSETDQISEEMVHKVKMGESNINNWKNIDSDSSLEKVWKFVCLYKDEKN